MKSRFSTDCQPSDYLTSLPMCQCPWTMVNMKLIGLRLCLRNSQILRENKQIEESSYSVFLPGL